MKQQLSDYGVNLIVVPKNETTLVPYTLQKNQILHSRDKQIKVRNHSFKDHVEKRECILEFATSSIQLADIFTKSLPKENFFFIRTKLKLLNKSCIN